MKNCYKLLLSLLLFLTLPAFATGTLPSQVDGKALPSLAPMLKNTMPGVVNIAVEGVLPTVFNPADPNQQRKPSEPMQRPGRNQPTPNQQRFASVGSGVIVDADKGYIITNGHVVDNAKRITVTLGDGRQFKAKLIGTDDASDLSVLQIKAINLTAIPFGDSDKLQVGDFVTAIGNPFGLRQTVTSGVVSALQRYDLGIEGYENFIQTDAPINFGNSGGALVDLQGQLVGINTAILSPEGGSIGIGFAIPSNMVHSVMTQLIKYGEVKRGLIGIGVQNLTPALADAFGTKLTEGAVVSQVSPGSPADLAGIKVGDIITDVNQTKITNANQVSNTVGLERVGSTVTIKLNRQGQALSVSATLIDPQNQKVPVLVGNPLLMGLDMRDYQQLTTDFGLINGVLIVRVDEDSPGWEAPLRPGDIITAVNGTPVKNLLDLGRIAKQSYMQKQKQLLLHVMRLGSGGPDARFVALTDNG